MPTAAPPAAAPVKPLPAASAAAIARAEQRVTTLEANLAKAKEDREEVRARYRDMIPLNTDVRGGRHVIRRWKTGGGESFSLKEFRKAGKKVTAAMRPFIGERQQGEAWKVTTVPTEASAKV